MIKLILLGDTHIPDRASKIHPDIKEFIEIGKPWSIVVFTGDLTCKEILDWINGLGRKVYTVKGNIDYLPLPRSHVFNIEEHIVGVHHGDGVYPRGDTVKLSSLAKSLKANILITGHTHSDFIKTSPDKSILLLNPGSLTGVWGGGGGSFIPSFMIMQIEEKELVIETVRLINGDLRKFVTYVRYYDGKWIL